MDIDDFNYELPKGLIAQRPVRPRSNSRLMIVDNGKIEHKHFYDVVDYLQRGDTLVINESKVKPAKLVGRKITGGKAEVIIEKKVKDGYLCRVKASKPRVGTELLFGDVKNDPALKCGACFEHELRNFQRKFLVCQKALLSYTRKSLAFSELKLQSVRLGDFRHVKAKIIDKNNDAFTIKFSKNLNQKQLKLPTPPYVKEEIRYNSWYQTVYSRKQGSLAAPTAGLHFTKELLDKIRKKGVNIAKVCLHISFGTFLPVRDKNITGHKMDKEFFSIDNKNAEIINITKGRLIAVGTTSLKTLESACDENGIVKAGKDSSSLFIYPGYKFKSKTKAMITNFHLPKSTLLLMVSAFYGRERILGAYKEAVKNKYRFFSFGDAMLLVKP